MHTIEYQIRPVTRYIVTRFEGIQHEDGTESGGSESRGEYENEETAYLVGYALAKQEHDRLGWPVGDERIKYPRRPSDDFAQIGVVGRP